MLLSWGCCASRLVVRLQEADSEHKYDLNWAVVLWGITAVCVVQLASMQQILGGQSTFG